MSDKVHDAVVIGAGQAGLAVSYYLKAAQIEHVVLESAAIGESWRSQRWDSFKLNTPRALSGLPGIPNDTGPSDGFCTAQELVELFERYVDQFELPVQSLSTVTGLAIDGEERFVMELATGTEPRYIQARHVVVATGSQRVSKIPDLSASLPSGIHQLHAAEYRNAEALPAGSVLVVGSGQSGCQIAEDLLTSGRRVFVSTSKVVRLPRRYRGRDVMEWALDMGILDQTVSDLEDPSERSAAQPLMSGIGRHGQTISLQRLASLGATLLGRLRGASGGTLRFADDLADNIRFGDVSSAGFREAVDAFIDGSNLVALPRERDVADEPDPKLARVEAPLGVDAHNEDISTIIWCTGFDQDFGWIHVPALDDAGRPIHESGISVVQGLYFVGLPWQRSRKSDIILGADDDASFIVKAIKDRIQRLA